MILLFIKVTVQPKNLTLSFKLWVSLSKFNECCSKTQPSFSGYGLHYVYLTSDAQGHNPAAWGLEPPSSGPSLGPGL